MRRLAAAALVVGAVLGLLGTFLPSGGARGVAWGLDGIALIVGSALLAVHHLKRGSELLASAFLVFVVGQGLVLWGAAMDLVAAAPSFAAGTGLWAASMALVAASALVPTALRAAAGLAAVLFAVFSIQVLGGAALTALSRPLPFFAYPFLVLTLVGLAWHHLRSS